LFVKIKHIPGQKQQKPEGQTFKKPTSFLFPKILCGNENLLFDIEQKNTGVSLKNPGKYSLNKFSIKN
jgi:hypothetical protein